MTHLMDLGASSQIQGHCCWPLTRTKRGPCRGQREGPSDSAAGAGPTGGLLSGLLGRFLEQLRGLWVSVLANEGRPG